MGKGDTVFIYTYYHFYITYCVAKCNSQVDVITFRKSAILTKSFHVSSGSF